MTTQQIKALLDSVADLPDSRPVAINAGDIADLCRAVLGPDVDPRDDE